MKREAIISLVLAAGILLIGAVAYGHRADYGYQDNYGYGYGCGYGYDCDYQGDYNSNGYDPAVGAYTGYRDSAGNWKDYDNRHGQRNSRSGHSSYWMTGPRGCW